MVVEWADGGKTASNLRNAAAFLNGSRILVPKYLLCWVWQKGKPEQNKRRQERFRNFKRNFRCFLANFVFISYEAHYYQQRTFSEQYLLQGFCSIDTFGWTFETRDVQTLPRNQSRAFRPKDVTLPASLGVNFASCTIPVLLSVGSVISAPYMHLHTIEHVSAFHEQLPQRYRSIGSYNYLWFLQVLHCDLIFHVVFFSINNLNNFSEKHFLLIQ